MKKILGFLGPVAIIVIVVMAMGVGKMIGRGAVESFNEPNKRELISKVASEINKSLPMMVDRDTRLDTTAAGKAETIDYYYTLVNQSSREIDPAALASFTQKLKARVYSNEDMKPLYNAGIGATYIYHASDGVEAERILVPPSDCTSSFGNQSQATTLREPSANCLPGLHSGGT